MAAVLRQWKSGADRGGSLRPRLCVDNRADHAGALRRWRDANLDAGTILAQTTKTGRPRVLFFTPSTPDISRRIWPKREPNALLFEGRVAGCPHYLQTMLARSDKSHWPPRSTSGSPRDSCTYIVVATLTSFEPAAWQKVNVPMVVRPFLLAASWIGRHVLPSGPLARGPAGDAETVVGSASMFSGTTVYEVVTSVVASKACRAASRRRRRSKVLRPSWAELPGG